MGRSTKIDWCDSSWNPVTGCNHDCPYCYARGIAKRFGAHFTYFPRRIHVREKPMKLNERVQPYPYDFEPTLHRYKLDEPQHWKKPRTIFVCSMSDLFGDWVPDEWILDIFAACRKAPQHRYLFLTKNPGRYISLAKLGLLPEEDNFWFGSTTPNPLTPYFYTDRARTFVSIEPIQGDFGAWNTLKDMELPNWIIVGAETGNRKGKIVPEKAWIEKITKQAYENNIPVFMKESLRTIMGENFIQEFPWEEEKWMVRTEINT